MTTPQRSRPNRKRKKSETTFAHTIDRAAFVDTIVLSINAGARLRWQALSNVKHHPILHERGNYSRAAEGIWDVTGNPITVVYGKVARMPRLPQFLVKVRSESMPVTGAQVAKLVQDLFPRGADVRVSSVELTFDLKGTSYADICRTIEHRASRSRKMGDEDTGGHTLYVGSSRSLWSARIYEKKKGVLRVEFVFRRGYLSARRISSPNDLVLLRKLNLRRLFSLRQFSATRLAKVTKNWDSSLREIIGNWKNDGRPIQRLRQWLSVNRVQIGNVLEVSGAQRKLERMLKLLIW
jgi:hypothetical protein